MEHIAMQFQHCTLGMLDGLSAICYTHHIADKGHRHSSGVSEVSFYISPKVPKPPSSTTNVCITEQVKTAPAPSPEIHHAVPEVPEIGTQVDHLVMQNPEWIPAPELHYAEIEEPTHMTSTNTPDALKHIEAGACMMDMEQWQAPAHSLLKHTKAADSLPLRYTPSAMLCSVVSGMIAAPRPSSSVQPGLPCSSMQQLGRTAGAQAIASTKLRGRSHRSHTAALDSDLEWKSGAALSGSLSDDEWQSLLNARLVVENNSECTRCTGTVKVEVLSWALCGTCEQVSTRMPATQCTSCRLTHCMSCRLKFFTASSAR